MGDNPDELVRKAHSKLAPGFFGKMFSSKESRVDEAKDLLSNAANMYKIRKNWARAGETYEELARLDTESGGGMAYSYYQDASHCFSFTDKIRSDQNLDRAIESCERAGKYMQAGKTAQRIANELEENFNYEKAIENKNINGQPVTNKVLVDMLLPATDKMQFTVDCPKNFFGLPALVQIPSPSPPKELQKFALSRHPSSTHYNEKQYMWLKVKFSSKNCLTYEGDITLKNIDNPNDVRIYKLYIDVRPKDIKATL